MTSQARHVFSVDVEEWFHGIELPQESWAGRERRLTTSMTLLLDLLDEAECTATCFVLGKVVEEVPELVREIHRRGHEIGTHGYSHDKVYEMTPVRFRNELRRSIDLLQDLVGQAVVGHRAAYFSITERSLWALDILAEEGILYDSSIQPVRNPRYGIPSAQRVAHELTLESGRRLLELPVASLPVGKQNLPVGGGAYLRIYPYRFLRWCLGRLRTRGERFGIYIHPWELDPDHPRLDLPRRVGLTHYVNLATTRNKLRRLLRDFRFASVREVHRVELEHLTL